jgi:hypothetical protein
MSSITTSPSSADVIPFEPKPQSERFVMLRYSLLDSSAWQSLPSVAVDLYVKIARKYNGRNNGRIRYSVRDGAEALRASKGTASRELKRLQDGGLIRRVSRGSFNRKTGETTASEWELTEYRVAPVKLDADRVAPQVQSSCTTGTSIDVDIKIDKKESRGLSKEEAEKEERRKRWLAEGKSEFTGIPKWKRGGR